MPTVWPTPAPTALRNYRSERASQRGQPTSPSGGGAHSAADPLRTLRQPCSLETVRTDWFDASRSPASLTRHAPCRSARYRFRSPLVIGRVALCWRPLLDRARRTPSRAARHRSRSEAFESLSRPLATPNRRSERPPRPAWALLRMLQSPRVKPLLHWGHYRGTSESPQSPSRSWCRAGFSPTR